jgi:hypothetical protein
MQRIPLSSPLAAFQAGGASLSVRRGETDRIAKPMRVRNGQRQLFLRLRPRSIRGTHHPALRRSALSPHPSPCSAIAPGSSSTAPTPKSIGSNFILERPSLHHHRHHPSRLLRRNPAQRSARPMASHPAGADLKRKSNSLLPHFQAWLRIIGRLRPDVPPEPSIGPRMAARLTAEFANGS